MQRNTLVDKIIKYVESCSDKIDHDLTEEQFSKLCKGIQSLIDTYDIEILSDTLKLV